MTRPELPSVAVIYDIGSAQPVEISTAARRLCAPTFVINGGRTGAPWPPISPARQRMVCDVAGLGAAEVAVRLRERRIEHIVTFSERQLLFTAEVARAAGFRFLSMEAALNCRDKLRQRHTLAAAGVDVVRTRTVRTPHELVDALPETGLPAVLKPRFGMGSIDTVRIDSVRQGHDWLRDRLESTGEVTEFVVEELLRGDPRQAGDGWGDYVSVESIVEDSVVRHVAVTGKFPLTEPFRETGMVVPSSLGPHLEEQVRSVTGQAVRALGIDTGVTHTELKLTSTGPRVIEVNARLGGYVTDIVRRSTGFDLLRAALANAIGHQVRGLPVTVERVAYQYFLQPPKRVGVLAGLDGIEKALGIPGVRHFEPMTSPGSRFDWRWGTGSHLGVLHGEADDHQAALESVRQATAVLTPRYA